jgi:predicted transcriptional regulator
VPGSVKDFIARHIESVEQLDVLLLLRATPTKDWTADEVQRALVTQPESAASWLKDLEGRGLAKRDGRSYRFAPPTPEIERTIDALAEAYAKYRVTVIGLIFSKPSERITTFADAFRIKRKN